MLTLQQLQDSICTIVQTHDNTVLHLYKLYLQLYCKNRMHSPSKHTFACLHHLCTNKHQITKDALGIYATAETSYKKIRYIYH